MGQLEEELLFYLKTRGFTDEMAKNILIIRLSSLGDIILTSPFVINTSINYRDAKITYLTKNKFLPLVKMIPGIDEVVTIDDDMSFIKYLSFLNKLKQTKFDKGKQPNIFQRGTLISNRCFPDFNIFIGDIEGNSKEQSSKKHAKDGYI